MANKITLASILFLTIFTYSNAKLRHLKETKLTVYYQNYSSRPNATVIEIPGPANGTENYFKFGAMFSVDDPITEEFDEGSAIIARGRGLFVTSALDGSSSHVMLSVVFIDGEHKGSSIEIYGNEQRSMVREVAVVGGTGKFRLARGYVTFENLYFDPVRGHTILQSNMTVLHY
ncbi:dirigent protein 22-like [Salvia hispanica]|uniref:dirigent protein 22-like n=1 Tax=Salvia hispanica TaxID=49212 RepID=UPI002009CF35|nr:dirigent protein 22-like [Salvia hispanica]